MIVSRGSSMVPSLHLLNLDNSSHAAYNVSRPRLAQNREQEPVTSTSISSPSTNTEWSIANTNNLQYRNHGYLEQRQKEIPWMQKRYKSADLDGLNDEVIDLHNWLKPTAEEICLRHSIFNHIQHCLNKQYPEYKVGMFGSVASTSFLPSSDIDIYIDSKTLPNDDDQNSFSFKCDVLRNARILLSKTGIYDSLELLDKTTIPLLKFKNVNTSINIDMSVDIRHAQSTSHWIDRKRQIPCFEPLFLIIKQFLHQNNLNLPFNGGLPSYALACMLVYYIEGPNFGLFGWKGLGKASFGKLLVGFFEFYGKKFDYLNDAIRLTPEPSIIPKDVFTDFGDERYSAVLWIEDPIQPGNNLGKCAHNILKVKAAFSYAHDTITKAFIECSKYPSDYIKKYYWGPILSLGYIYHRIFCKE